MTPSVRQKGQRTPADTSPETARTWPASARDARDHASGKCTRNHGETPLPPRPRPPSERPTTGSNSSQARSTGATRRCRRERDRCGRDGKPRRFLETSHVERPRGPATPLLEASHPRRTEDGAPDGHTPTSRPRSSRRPDAGRLECPSGVNGRTHRAQCTHRRDVTRPRAAWTDLADATPRDSSQSQGDKRQTTPLCEDLEEPDGRTETGGRRAVPGPEPPSGKTSRPRGGRRGPAASAARVLSGRRRPQATVRRQEDGHLPDNSVGAQTGTRKTETLTEAPRPAGQTSTRVQTQPNT